MNKHTLDIVLPCYNPGVHWEENIISSYRELSVQLRDTTLRLFIINDGSTRGIDSAAVDRLQTAIPDCRWISYALNRGKGHALRTGVQHCTGAYTIYTDVDFPYTIHSIVSVFAALLDGADVAAGIKDDYYYRNVPPFRRFISRVLRKMTAALLGMEISDTQCGLKGFNAKGREVFLHTVIERYLFDLEFLYLASCTKDLKLRAVPVRLRENVVFSEMPLRVLLSETGNFCRLLLRRFFGRNTRR